MKKKFKSALLNNAVAFPTKCARQMYRGVRPGAAARERERESKRGLDVRRWNDYPEETEKETNSETKYKMF